MEFKKTDRNELERTITFVLCFILIAMQAVIFMEQLKVLPHSFVEYGSVILPLGCLILLMFDVMMLMQIKNKSINVFGILAILSMLSVVISYFVAEDKEIAISGRYLHAEGVFVCLSYVLVLINASLIGNKKNRRIIYYTFIAIAIFEVILGVLQAVIQPDFLKPYLEDLYFESFRAFGTMENPNPFASLMVIFLSIETIMLYYSQKMVVRILHAIMIVFCSFEILLSGTRGAVIGYGLAALVFCVVLIRDNIKNKAEAGKTIKSIGIVIGCIVLGFVIANTVAGKTVDNIGHRIDNDANATNVGDVGNARVRIWKESLRLGLEKPVFGVGLSNLYMEVPVADFNLINYDAHNRYLQTFCVQGIFGLIVYLALIVYVLIVSINKIKKYGLSQENGLYLAILMALISYLIADFFCIGVYALAPFSYIIMGMLVANVKE